MSRILYALILSSALHAAPIIRSTGTDNTGALVAAGALSPTWELYEKPATATQTIGSNPFRYFNGAYFADNMISAWVSPGIRGSAGATGFYGYRTAIDLTGYDLSTIEFAGRWGTDNSGQLLINGILVDSAPFSGFGTPRNFTINSGLTKGINYLEVRVNNQGDPTAFRVEINRVQGSLLPVNPIPEPSSFAFAALAIGAAALRVFRR